jgi:hypothetical protein
MSDLRALGLAAFEANRPAFINLARNGYQAEGQGCVMLEFNHEDEAETPRYAAEAAMLAAIEVVGGYDPRRELVLLSIRGEEKAIEVIEYTSAT